jgi:hypothetical protein
MTNPEVLPPAHALLVEDNEDDVASTLEAPKDSKLRIATKPADLSAFAHIL